MWSPHMPIGSHISDPGYTHPLPTPGLGGQKEWKKDFPFRSLLMSADVKPVHHSRLYFVTGFFALTGFNAIHTLSIQDENLL